MEITIQECYQELFADECSSWLEEAIKEYSKENTLMQIICATVDKMSKKKIELLKETYDYKYDLQEKTVIRLKKENDNLINTNSNLSEENTKLKDNIDGLNKQIAINISNYEYNIEVLKEKIKELEHKISFYKKASNTNIEEVANLVERDKILTALEDGGVDNWEWYEESLEKAELI